jgi:hypothetical protein
LCPWFVKCLEISYFDSFYLKMYTASSIPITRVAAIDLRFVTAGSV